MPESWAWGLVGGSLIGLSAAFLWLGLGRIAGISGIVGGGLHGAPAGDRSWRVAFVLGLVLSGFLFYGTDGASIALPDSSAGLIAAGLLVGFGTRRGNGCTSGHGVCGLSRGSLRSLGATVTFMVAAVATVFVLRHGGA